MKYSYKFGPAIVAALLVSTAVSAQSSLISHANGENGGGYRIGGVQSQDFQRVAAAREFIRVGRNDAALALLTPLSAKGFATAQTVLGGMYAIGRGVERDAQRATQLYASAAHNGDAQAMYLYGYALDTGTGIDQNRELAKMWMQRASDSGQIELQKAVRAYRSRTKQ